MRHRLLLLAVLVGISAVLPAQPATAAAPALPADVTQMSTPFVDPFQRFVVTRAATGDVLFGQVQPGQVNLGVLAMGSLGGQVLGDPQAANVPGGVMVFARDPSNQVVTRTVGVTAGFTALPGLLVSSEIEVVELSGINGELVRIFARGRDDGAVYTNLLTSGGWTGWRSLGGFTTSEISASLVPGVANTFRVVIRGADNRVQSTVLFSDGTSSGWVPLGGPTIRGNIALARGGFAGLRGNEIFVVDQATRAVMTFNFDAPGWRNLGGVATSDVSAIVLFDGSVEFVVRGTTNNMYVNRRRPGETNFVGYVNIGGILTANPAIGGTAIRNDPAAVAYVRGTNQRLFVKFQRSNFDFTEYRVVSSVPTAA